MNPSTQPQALAPLQRLMGHLPFKPVTLGLIAASVLTLAALGLVATRSEAADAAKPAAKPATPWP